MYYKQIQKFIKEIKCEIHRNALRIYEILLPFLTFKLLCLLIFFTL